MSLGGLLIVSVVTLVVLLYGLVLYLQNHLHRWK